MSGPTDQLVRGSFETRRAFLPDRLIYAPGSISTWRTGVRVRFEPTQQRIRSHQIRLSAEINLSSGAWFERSASLFLAAGGGSEVDVGPVDMNSRFAVLLARRGKWTGTVTAAGNASRDTWRNVTGRSTHLGRRQDRWVRDKVGCSTSEGQSGASEHSKVATRSSTSSMLTTSTEDQSSNSKVDSSNHTATTTTHHADTTPQVGTSGNPTSRNIAPGLPSGNPRSRDVVVTPFRRASHGASSSSLAPPVPSIVSAPRPSAPSAPSAPSVPLISLPRGVSPGLSVPRHPASHSPGQRGFAGRAAAAVSEEERTEEGRKDLQGEMEPERKAAEMGSGAEKDGERITTGREEPGQRRGLFAAGHESGKTTGVLIAGLKRSQRGVWSRAAAAASEVERREEGRKDLQRELQGETGQSGKTRGVLIAGMKSPQRGVWRRAAAAPSDVERKEERRETEAQGVGEDEWKALGKEGAERGRREREGAGWEAGRKEDGRRKGGMQGLVAHRVRGNIVIPPDRWEYVQQQLAIIRSRIPPPAYKSPASKSQSPSTSPPASPPASLTSRETTVKAPAGSLETPSERKGEPRLGSDVGGGRTQGLGEGRGDVMRERAKECRAEDGRASEAGEKRQGGDSDSKIGLIWTEQPKLILPQADTAKLTIGKEDTSNLDKGGEEQRTEEWFAMRAGRLTASAFEKAVGFYPKGRQQLWEEKVGVRAPFAGNEATQWGQGKEEEALLEYARLTGGEVEHRAFQIYKHHDPTFSWLGASPDGLLPSDPLSLHSSPLSPGVLEIKCPWNRGSPLSASPYPSVPFYYMPQIQGLLEIFDRDWLDFFVWTKMGGSALFRVERDKEYWRLLFTALEEFWWQHVVPAKEALGEGRGEEEVRGRFYPGQAHDLMREIRLRSERISNGCRMVLKGDARK
ncbi:hypothetical protein CLOM_g22034 [Closterium sp. NIES-68]|nr:hypothetical protein CLOM_g22034 [Closterium sp. NIES-68]GJP77783.1 hypothetical protein CLOP_g8128 [Closterium sp. NIES-67]